MNETALESALNAIPADDRETWVRMAMAVKSELGEQGFDVWDRWSRTSPAYRERDAVAVWKSVDEIGETTVGTLVHEARRCGWTGWVDFNDKASTRKEIESREHQQMQEREHAQARRRAANMLAGARLAPHPYLASKGFPRQRVFTLWHLMLLPMRDVQTNQLNSLQLTNPDGSKKFLKGSQARGCVYRFGSTGATPWHCEGFATGLSVHHALQLLNIQHEIIVCFSAGNLGHVADSGFVVADHDLYRCGYKPCKNKWDAPWGEPECPECGSRETLIKEPDGEKYARQTGLPFWTPPEPETDANDFHQRYGLEALADELQGLRKEENLPMSTS